ncbi:MptD family putative ECF transporter S component [Alkalibaculum sporogenes]|uniref:MptD family putative ECF transporter S component n=1 Tax=Alkalibaculum sporogenes TaxID=2655001 RepID=UPI00128C8890
MSHRRRLVQICVVVIPFVLGVLTAIPFILFVTKTKKFGMVTLKGTLLGMICFLMGQSWKKTIISFCIFT